MSSLNNKYELVSGLELHVQLNTRTKAFCSDQNEFGVEPNTLISPVSLAHPGTLPVVNMAIVDKAIKLGLALGSTISKEIKFDRKNYFYPDLPKGYQLTQDAMPICVGGAIHLSKSDRTIRIHHIHLEEDAGKSIHDLDEFASMVDLNRAGVPLVEVVTEPDFRSSEEVSEFIEMMQKLVVYLGISDGNMEEGSVRCDCNVSIRPTGSDTFGQRCEIKNINSKRFAKMAVEYEYARQIKMVESGQTVSQQTLHFDKEQKITYAMRSKEDAHDYRYFPDPDLPVFKLSEERLAKLRNGMLEMPWNLEEKLINEYGLNKSEATIIAYESDTVTFVFSTLNSLSKKYHTTFRDLLFQKILKEETLDLDSYQSAFQELSQLIGDKKVNKVHAYDTLFELVINNPHTSVQELAKSNGLLQTDDQDEIATIVQKVLVDFPAEKARLAKGEKKLIGFFIGQIVKASKGKVPPQEARKVLMESIN